MIRAKTGLVSALVALIGACASKVHLIAAAPVDVDLALSSLTVGEASMADVRAALGEPTGEGRLQYPIDAAPRDQWYYYFEVGEVDTTKIEYNKTGSTDAFSTPYLELDYSRTFLFLYFEDEVLDGYMWWSNLDDHMPVLNESEF